MNLKVHHLLALAAVLVISANVSAQEDVASAASPSLTKKQVRKQARKIAREKNRNEVKALEKNGFDPRDATGYPENIQRAQAGTHGSAAAPTNPAN